MLLLTPGQLKTLADWAEAAYPNEACGLFIGHAGPSERYEVARLVQSPNVADDKHRRFEVDPGLRIGLERELRGGAQKIIGVWHSHPDGPSRPSATDLAAAFEPEFVWVITAVMQGQVTMTEAYLLRDKVNGFRPIKILTTDDLSAE